MADDSMQPRRGDACRAEQRRTIGFVEDRRESGTRARGGGRGHCDRTATLREIQRRRPRAPFAAPWCRRWRITRQPCRSRSQSTSRVRSGRRRDGPSATSASTPVQRRSTTTARSPNWAPSPWSIRIARCTSNWPGPSARVSRRRGSGCPFKASNRPSALGSTGSPLAGLALLTRNGAVLKDDGTVSVDGTAMHQFVVHVTKRATTSVVSRHEAGLPLWLAEPTSRGPLGASSVTIDVTAAGRIGRIKFTTSAKQDGTFATVQRDRDRDELRRAGHDHRAGEKAVDVRRRVGGHADALLRPAAGTTPRPVVQADRHSPLAANFATSPFVTSTDCVK